ncbi:MAG: hypothetical protein KGO50_06270, partial [Myxococcales bacterium]|nr:hypothetical protein [Myxococcales bacterium]
MSLDTYLLESQAAHLEELKALLRIPSVSTNDAFKADVAACAEFVCGKLRDAGLTAKVYATPKHPIVYGEWLGAPGA